MTGTDGLAERPLAWAGRHPRLPVWPVAAGVAGWAFEAVGLRSAAGWLEHRFGGRVTPMSLPTVEADPFLMLVHHRHSFSPWDPVRPFSAMVMPEGFPAHPHRGFETATLVLEGGMRHRDSVGIKMTYRAGSVQWLTAGRGVMHEEMWEPGVPVHELYQLWVNLPRAHKWDAPQIQLLGPAEVEGPGPTSAPLPVGERDGVSVSVYAGACRGVVSPVRTRSPMVVARLVFGPAADFVWDEVPADHTALVYVRSGSVEAGGRTLTAGELGGFLRGPGPARLRLRGSAGAELLLLTGAPLGEPVAMGGSMVMSTREEVEQAHADVARGVFGRPWSPSAPDAVWRAGLGDRGPAAG